MCNEDTVLVEFPGSFFLLPCPCCGGEAELSVDHDADMFQEWNRVYCTKCGLEITGCKFNPNPENNKEEIKSLIAAWNTRVNQSK